MNIFRSINKPYKITTKLVNTTAKAVLLAFLVTGTLPVLQAQVSQTVYFMDRLPQSSLINPAIQHYHNFHIGLPGISSLNVNARTNFFSFSDLIFKHPQYDSLISFLHPDVDIRNFTSRLRDRNTIAPDLHVNILSFGFRTNRSFVSFNISERASTRANLPKDLVLLGLHGNEQFIDKEADFTNIGVDMNYFREYAAGFSYRVDDRLNVGGRAKLLFGKANLSFADSDINIYTDPDSYNMRLRSKFTMNLSMPVTLVKDEDGEIEDIIPHFDNDGYDPLDFILNSRNAGFALDIGATYRIIDQVTVYASITDLGFINWKQDVYNLTMDGDFDFDGIDLSSLFNYADDSDPADNLLDSLKGIFSIDDTQNSFSRGLPTRIYLGGTYDLHRTFSLGLLSRSEIYQNNLEQALTLSGNLNLGRRLSTSVSYSMMNNSYNNFGMGLSLRGLMFQFYMITDNLNTIFYPHRTNSVNLWFGFNMMFGHVKNIQALPSR